MQILKGIFSRIIGNILLFFLPLLISSTWRVFEESAVRADILPKKTSR